VSEPESTVKLLVLSGAEVRGLLSPGACADAMRDALAARARGEVYQPLRMVLRPDGAGGFMGLMPCYRHGQDKEPGATGPGLGGFGLKAICIMPGNPARGLDAHQGVVLLSSAETGEPLAILNASATTEIRTAAVSAVATALLARADATELAIIGTGVQARSHLMAISAERPLAQIRIAGRDQARARRFAEEMRAQTAVPVRACASAAEAVDGADIVVTVTSSAEPVLRREWLVPGAHVNAVGACVPQARELDTATVAAAALFADSRESVLAESGDFRLAQAEGAIGPDHIRAEIGDVLTGSAAGRTSEDEITVFESLGLAVEDLAAAALAYRKAEELGPGTWVEF
jgi:ornithine cyclodeaminase/alanine dehydrogenase-like protein (mu-crystallin family)